MLPYFPSSESNFLSLYVGLAKRLKEESPDLFEAVRAGDMTIPEAMRQLDGITDDPYAVRVKTVRRPLNRLLGNVAEFA